ncbi:unnamed protein product [Clonostachys solani]|uniref:Maltose/galactoside acetyltransferase domain-containing protein n=1 Tax=Clonostachys solani TaxID=160281 RepID=A0A9N9ZIV3_9HYPO|nr:unnamed protein product [Clonostachys solani]
MERALSHQENVSRMLRGDLFYSFTPELVAARERCHGACKRFNAATDLSRREQVRLWKEVIDDDTPLPEDDDALSNEPYIEAPIMVDYGTNLKLGKDVYINFSCTFLDSCPITIGSRTLIGPNCSLYATSHPIDGHIRDGTKGPECAQPIVIGKDCWLGGNVIVLQGVTIGNGVTVGAGSVVTKDVPDYTVVAGNPARVLKKLEPPPSKG